jgi:hypothetical protein
MFSPGCNVFPRLPHYRQPSRDRITQLIHGRKPLTPCPSCQSGRSISSGIIRCRGAADNPKMSGNPLDQSGLSRRAQAETGEHESVDLMSPATGVDVHEQRTGGTAAYGNEIYGNDSRGVLIDTLQSTPISHCSILPSSAHSSTLFIHMLKMNELMDWFTMRAICILHTKVLLLHHSLTTDLSILLTSATLNFPVHCLRQLPTIHTQLMASLAMSTRRTSIS